MRGTLGSGWRCRFAARDHPTAGRWPGSGDDAGRCRRPGGRAAPVPPRDSGLAPGPPGRRRYGHPRRGAAARARPPRLRRQRRPARRRPWPAGPASGTGPQMPSRRRRSANGTPGSSSPPRPSTSFPGRRTTCCSRTGPTSSARWQWPRALDVAGRRRPPPGWRRSRPTRPSTLRPCPDCARFPVKRRRHRSSPPCTTSCSAAAATR